MECRTCPACVEFHHGDGLIRHLCDYTGAEVFTGVPAEIANDIADAPGHVCPRTLLRPGRAGADERAVGVLRQVEARGRLGDLLATYTDWQRRKLEGLLAEASAAAVA